MGVVRASISLSSGSSNGLEKMPLVNEIVTDTAHKNRTQTEQPNLNSHRGVNIKDTAQGANLCARLTPGMPSYFFLIFIVQRSDALDGRLDEVGVRGRGLQIQGGVEGGEGGVRLPQPLVHLAQLEPDARLPRSQILPHGRIKLRVQRRA